MFQILTDVKTLVRDLLALEQSIGNSPEWGTVEQDVWNDIHSFQQQQAVTVKPSSAHAKGIAHVAGASILSIIELLISYAVQYGPAAAQLIQQIQAIVDAAGDKADAAKKPAEPKAA